MKFDLYDFDGTIYDGYSGVDLVLFGLRKYPKQWLRIPKMLWYGLMYFLHLTSKTKMKSVMFSFVQYIDDMDKFVLDFWNGHEKKLKDFWTKKKTHSRDIIISASGYFWLQYIADKYKVYDLFATTYDIKTGEVIGLNCHGKEKVNMFYNKYPKGIIDKMYTDSKNDLPLIEEAKEGFLVKGNVVKKYYD